MENETANPATARELSGAPVNGAARSDAPTATAADRQPVIRYMDDATFRRCLDKVVTVHGRLLAELAK